MIKKLLFLSLCICFSLPAAAGQPEAREVARINNCTPKKIDVYQNQLGSEGETEYQVTCTLPKTADTASKPGPDALLIGCTDQLCELIRPMSLETK
jgi:hypothetical protein